MPRRDARFSDALTCYHEGRFVDALTLIDELISVHATSAVCHLLKGIVLKDSGSDAEAVVAFDRALALDPQLDRAHYHRGTARFLAGDKAGAVADLSIAIEREPQFLFAVYNLGVAAVALRDWELAAHSFTDAMELDPANLREYVGLLVEIGRSSAQEEVYSQGHRLKNMLGVIGDDYRGLVAGIEAAAAMVPEAWRAHARALEADLGQLYEDMVGFLRAVDQQPPKLAVIDMADLLDRCLFALSPSLAGIEVQRSIAVRMPDVIGDRKSLSEALMNVLNNAVEACGKCEQGNGIIRIDVAAVDDVVDVPGVDTVRVRVADSGPGIPESLLEHVFDLGFTTKRFGSGLGLSYAHRVIGAHGGRIEVGNLSGSGAAVTLYVPASPMGAPNLRNLSLRSVLFEDLRALAIRGGMIDAMG